jgi:hypothetical protein
MAARMNPLALAAALLICYGGREIEREIDVITGDEHGK